MRKAIIGNGGHAREVIAHLNTDVTIFVTDNHYNILDKKVKPLSTFDPSIYEIMICIGDPKIREQIFKTLPKETKFFSYVHPTSIILDKNIKIEDGTFIGPFCVLTTNINIGKQSILLRNVSIGHDCVIGDYFTSMSNTTISGDVILGQRNYFGNNSSIREKLTITDDVIVGMNDCVVKDINESGTYVGVPVKKIK